MAKNDISERLHDLILTVEKRLKTENKSSLTPKWLIKNDQIFSSKIVGYEDSSPCHAIWSGSSNLATQDSSGNLRVGKIELDNCLVCMDLGIHDPLLQEKMHGGKVLEQIVIRRMSSIENAFRAIQTKTFTACRITSCQHISSLFGFAFGCIQIEDAIHE